MKIRLCEPCKKAGADLLVTLRQTFPVKRVLPSSALAASTQPSLHSAAIPRPHLTTIAGFISGFRLEIGRVPAGPLICGRQGLIEREMFAPYANYSECTINELPADPLP